MMIKAELIDHMGDDLRVVNAARVSFHKESDWETKSIVARIGDDGPREIRVNTGSLSLSDSRLINYLARHNHFTPFTHCTITIREEVPIFVARQRFKHVVGFTYNEVSRRYVSDDPEFYQPEVWRKKAENVKQGSSSEPVVSMTFRNNVEAWNCEPADAYTNLCETALSTYQSMLDAGVCPEQARMVLPQSMMTSYYVTGSLMAFARAYKQRSDFHSQKEIRDLADHWDRIIGPLFPESWLALTQSHA